MIKGKPTDQPNNVYVTKKKTEVIENIQSNNWDVYKYETENATNIILFSVFTVGFLC